MYAMKVYNLQEKQEYINEIAMLTQKEWGSKASSNREFLEKVNRKVEKIVSSMGDNNYCKLVLVDNNTLIGFISIFPHDCDERADLSPWYATMFVKQEYRGRGYSRILNEAILEEARKRGFQKIYLKTNLENYYEKFGAHYLETLKNGEKLFYFELSLI